MRNGLLYPLELVTLGVFIPRTITIRIIMYLGIYTKHTGIHTTWSSPLQSTGGIATSEDLRYEHEIRGSQSINLKSKLR